MPRHHSQRAHDTTRLFDRSNADWYCEESRHPERPLIDIAAVRAHFPSLARQHGGETVLYFDNPAGTQVPRETMAGFTRYLEHSNANVGGPFDTSRSTDTLIGEVRAGMADLLGARAPEEIVFGPNMTTLAFQISHALARVLKPGDEVITTELEHDANVAPWLALEDQGIVVKRIPVRPEDMTLDLDAAAALVSERTRLLAVGYASNAFGTVNAVRALADLAHSVNAWVFVDAVHYVPHGPVDVQSLGCDLLACSPYKFFGPHLGVLYGRAELLDTLPVSHVRPAGATAPGMWETGTKNHEALSGLHGTLSYLASLGTSHQRKDALREAMTAIQNYERTLSRRLIEGLVSMPRVRVYGITDTAFLDCRVPTVSFTIRDLDPVEGARKLGARGIFSWAGDHYAVEPMKRLGLKATQRVGLVHYNTRGEIEHFLESVDAICP